MNRGSILVINKEKQGWYLRWPLGETPHRTILSHIHGETDFLPRNSCVFHPTAALTAAALSMSAGDEKLLRDNLTELDYHDILTVAYAHTERDKIGMCLASRVRDDTLQIAVVLRGTEGDEWYSNFDLGYTAEHSGFAKAADFAELKLGDYVFTHAIGLQPSFFVTGYSRGGAVANILAKRLCDRYGLERVCAYTFASPNTTISRRTNRYTCIFNLERQEDFFTRVPPAGWGYTKYGKTISLSDIGDMTAGYRALTGEDYIGFTRQSAVNNFLCALQTLAPNVHAYYERRRQIGSRRLSLYEFMRVVAAMLSDHMDADAADIFLSAMVSEYADLMSFLSSGADLTEIIGSGAAIPKCSVADSHSPAAYMASLAILLPQ